MFRLFVILIKKILILQKITIFYEGEIWEIKNEHNYNRWSVDYKCYKIQTTNIRKYI